MMNLHFFLTDEAIGNKKKVDDKLGRKEYAGRLVEKLLIGKFQTSFAVGITGEWGAGKTSFISLMKDSLEISTENIEEKIITLEFNPWNSQTSSQIIEDFFTIFQKELKPYSSTISSEIISYAKNLVDSTKGNWWVLPKQIISYFDKPISIQDRFSHINDKLKIIDKKIFVIIDDLDRLDKEEVIEVIRLIRNTANFYNTCFIVGYDKGYVNAAIKGISDYRSKYYLEKIFQLEIVLPHMEDNFYFKGLCIKVETVIGSDESDKLLGLYKKALDYSKDKTLKDNKDAYYFYFIISSIIDSYRDINRFVNVFALTYGKAKDDVNLAHFILLEALRYKYPLVVDSMYKQTNELFSFNFEENLILLNGQNIIDSVTFTINEEGFNNLRNKIQKSNISRFSDFRQIFDRFTEENTEYSVLDNFLSEFDLKKADKNIISIFFKLIFDKNASYKAKHLLNHPNHYFNYFSFRVAKDAISIIEFKTIVEGNNTEKFKEKINEWLRLDKKNIEDCFYNYSPTDYETYKTYILGFLHAAKIMQSSKEIRFNTRMDKVLEEKLPDLKIGDNQKELETFFNTEFIESAKYPFVEELRYLNNIMKIHFYEKWKYNKELKELEESSNSQEEIHDFESSYKPSKINLFLVITAYKCYIEKFLKKAGTVKNLDSKEFKNFFKEVAGTNGWFHLAGISGSKNEKKEFQTILKKFIERHSKDDVYKIVLNSVEEEEITDNNGVVVDIRQFEGHAYMGIGSLFKDYDAFKDFLEKLQYDKIKNIGEIQESYYRDFFKYKDY